MRSLRSVLVASIVAMTMSLPVGGALAQPVDLEAARALIATQAYTEAAAILRPLAEAGDAEAQHELGLLYLRGNGVQADPAQAVYWFTLAAEQGLAVAQIALGLRYVNGEGVEVDFAAAMHWFQAAAAQGNPAAAYQVGLRYANGEGVEVDFVEAVRWMQVAADGGFVAAQFQLGVAYVLGQGVEADDYRAFVHFAIAYLLSGQDLTGPLFAAVDDIAARLTVDQRDQGVAEAEAWIAAFGARAAE